MSAVSNRTIDKLTIYDMRNLIEDTVRHILADYTIEPRSYFIDDEGYLCFGNEQDYAAYVEKQDNPPSQVKAYFLEHGVQATYSDYTPTSEFAAELDNILIQIEQGAPLIEHSALRERVGL